MFMLLRTILIATMFLSFTSVYAQEWERPKSMPYPADNKPTEARVELGKLLFFDKRLSISNDISCASCHKPELAWTDGLSKAIGDKGEKGIKNTPTLLNSGHQTSYMWDGRLSSLEEQSVEPIIAKHEMNMPLETLVKKLSSIDGYRVLFENAYPKEGITQYGIAKAIASFERTIISDNTLFDMWIKNKINTDYPSDAVEGYRLFMGKGKCNSCHGEFNFSLGNFENIGLGDSKHEVKKNTQNSIWDDTRKTPTLRGAVKTAPYFHDGSVHTLEESVHICGNGGRYKDSKKSPFFKDRSITMDEMYKIVAFIKTLSSLDSDFKAPTKFPK